MTSTRILKVVPTLMCGGTENQFMALSRRLDPSRFALEFACLRRWGPFVDEIVERRIPLAEYRVTTFRSLRALTQQAKLARHIARRAIHIVHAYNFYGNVFAVPPARLAAPVVIASIRDCAPYLTPMQKRVQRYACQLADCILVNAEAVRRWLVAEGYDAAKIVVIPNGVDLTRFAAPPEPVRLRRELGLPGGTPVVVIVSRLTRLKGLEQLLEAAALVRVQHPEARFLIVGETAPSETAYLDVLTRLATAHRVADRVVFAGLRSDVPAVLAAADVSVMPSLNEALSNVLLESMAAGAPTVATHVGGTPEAIVDGETGLLVPPADVPALAAAIARLLADRSLAARLGEAGRRLIENRFSVERMVTATEHLYAELLARKGIRVAGPAATVATA
ncbi:MAG: glycosyltransferase [Acidobacteria bacterium]|nr:glycosyltransferase [Acidobacteriota bacterium]